MAERTISLGVKLVEGQNWPKPKNAKTPSKYHFSLCLLNGEVEKTKVISDAEMGAINIEKTFPNVSVEDLLNLVINNSTADVLYIKMIKGEDDKNAVEFGVLEFNISGLFTKNEVEVVGNVTITEEGAAQEEVPTVKLQLSVSEPLLPKKQVLEGNLLSITLGPVVNLPRGWLPKDAQNILDIPLDFTVACTLPIGQSHRTYFFRNGRMAMKPSKEDPERQEAVVQWPNEKKTFFIDSEAMKSIEKSCVNCECLNFKLYRGIIKEMMMDGWVDHNEKRYRSVFGKTLRDLLEPGVKVSKQLDIKLEHASSSDDFPSDPRPKSANKKKKKSKDPSPSQLLPEVADQDSKPYNDNGTAISIELSFDRALIPKAEDRTRTNMRPSDIIPKRPKVEKKKDIVEKYQEEISGVVDILVEEYRSLIERESNFDKDQFIFELNHTGKYFAFKERLKACVVNLVKEKFSHELKSKKEHEVKAFYNDIYVYLVKQMHVAINKIFNKAKKGEKDSNKQAPIHQENKKSDKWKQLADEAEFNFDYTTAAKYHQERIAGTDEELTSEMWYEYGVFSLRVKDLTKAEQSFRETLSRDIAHLECLRMNGILLCIKGQYKEAEVFLQSAVDLDNNSFISWGVLGMLFSLIGNEKQASQSFLYGDLALEKSNGGEDKSIPLKWKVANFLLEVNADSLAEKLLADGVQKYGETADSLYALAKMYSIREEYDLAIEKLQQSLKMVYKCGKTWELLGMIHLKLGNTAEAEKDLETALSVSDTPTASMLLRLASIYLSMELFDKSKDTYLNAAGLWSSCTAWLGAGISYYRLGEYNLSEQALNEANIQNNRNADVWGYLSLVALQNKREKEGEKCLREALKHGLKASNTTLIDEISASISQFKTMKINI